MLVKCLVMFVSFVYLVCSHEIYKASNSIFIKGAGILGLQLILLIWAAGCNCSNIVKVIMSAEAVLEIFSIVALIILFQIWYDDIVSAKHLLGWMIFIAYMDLTFHLGRLEVYIRVMKVFEFFLGMQ